MACDFGSASSCFDIRGTARALDPSLSCADRVIHDERRWQSPHTFHIPVMGTGFMIDAPLRVAKYGISSVISLVDDVLIEQMRQFHCEQEGEPYEEIAERRRGRPRPPHHGLPESARSPGPPAGRARCRPRPSSRAARSPATSRCCPSRRCRETTARCWRRPTPDERSRRQDQLRAAGRARQHRREHHVEGRPRHLSQRREAAAAIQRRLGGPARLSPRARLPRRSSSRPASIRGCTATPPSSPTSSPTNTAALKKKIILKVSDYHSAAVQGKFLAKRGLWVSEYRIESGLNCGGHAFATKGLLLGPILEEFQQKKRRTRRATARDLRQGAGRARPTPAEPTPPRPFASPCKAASAPPTKTLLLREHYGVDGTGWATPFLLVPEVTNVDDEHLAEAVRRGRRRRLSERQFAVRAAVLESAHVGQRGGPPPPHRRGPARQPLLEGLRASCSTPSSPRCRSARPRASTSS